MSESVYSKTCYNVLMENLCGCVVAHNFFKYTLANSISAMIDLLCKLLPCTWLTLYVFS